MNLTALLCWLRDRPIMCKITKHRRGKRFALTTWEKNEYETIGLIQYRCPRCKDTWTRKVRAKPAKPDTELTKEKTT